MSVPFDAECPDWTVDGSETRGSDFKRSVSAAYREMESFAPRAIIDSSTCRRWHLTLFRDHVPLDYYAGNFRQLNQDMRCLACNVQVAGIPGSMPQHVIGHIQTLFSEVRHNLIDTEIRWPELQPTERTMRIAITLARLIGQFIRIHPFVNGNGRMSRLIWAWGMKRFGLPFQYRVTMHPEDPTYDVLMSTAMRGDFDQLAIFMLRHIARFPPKQTTA